MIEGKLYSLVGHVAKLARTTATDNTGTSPIAVCAMTMTSLGQPVASFAMHGVKPASIGVANSKALTCLMQQCNTADLSDYDGRDATIAGHAYPFNGWDGGILLYNPQTGEVVGSLGVSGRSALGDRILAVRAAHEAGFKTDFNKDGMRVEDFGVDTVLPA